MQEVTKVVETVSCRNCGHYPWKVRFDPHLMPNSTCPAGVYNWSARDRDAARECTHYVPRDPKADDTESGK